MVHHVISYAGAQIQPGIWRWIHTVITSVHVPLFFALAGYLCHRQPLAGYFKKKVLRILLPFAVFSLLKILYSFVVSDAFAHGGSLPAQLFDAFVLGRTYWFPYAIFLCYCLGILCWPLAGKPAKYGVAALLCVIAVNTAADLPSVPWLGYFQLGNTLYQFGFFLAGMLIGQYQKQMASLWSRWAKYILLMSAVVSAVLTWLLVQGWLPHVYPVKYLLAFSLMILLVALVKKLSLGCRALKMIGKYSLQIMFFDSLLKVVLFAALEPLGIPVSLEILMIVAVDVAVGCGLCLLLEKIPGIRKLFGL